jgi:hypothetical protein
MRKGLLIVSLMVIALFAIGCEKALEEAMEAKMESETGENVEVDIDSGSMTVETDDGTATITTSGTDSDEWCNEDLAVSVNVEGQDGGSYQWDVVGIVESGEYKGLCHMKSYLNSPNGKIESDYYMGEDGDIAHMKVNSEGLDFDLDYEG